MESIGDVMRQKDVGKKQINAMLKKAEPDLKKDRQRMLDHAALQKAIQVNNKQTVLK